MRAPGWVLAAFFLGAAFALGLAVVYASIAAAPSLPEMHADPHQVRISAILIAAWAAGLFGAQVVAAVGLLRGRDWALVPATLACVLWAITCIGLPVAVAVLAGLWRARRSP